MLAEFLPLAPGKNWNLLTLAALAEKSIDLREPTERLEIL